MFHITLLDMPDTFSSFCSSPPQTTPSSLLLTGIRGTFCATPLAGMQFGHLAESSPHTQSTVTFSGAAVLRMWQHKTVLNRQKQFELTVACFGWPLFERTTRCSSASCARRLHESVGLSSLQDCSTCQPLHVSVGVALGPLVERPAGGEPWHSLTTATTPFFTTSPRFAFVRCLFDRRRSIPTDGSFRRCLFSTRDSSASMSCASVPVAILSQGHFLF